MLDDFEVSDVVKYLSIIGLILSMIGSVYALVTGILPGDTGAAFENGIYSLMFIIILILALFFLKERFKIIGIIFIIAAVVIFFTAGTIAFLGAILLFVAGVLILVQ